MNEALQIIEDIREDPKLNCRVKKCSQAAQDSFGKLINCIKGESGFADFQKYVGQIRQNTAFHYTKKLLKRALIDRSGRPEAKVSKITGGDHISLCRFEVADDILDSIVCRQIWKIPQGSDLRKEADRCSDFGSNLCLSLFDFAGEFIVKYIRDHAAI
ncbi:MAG: hypothetical protein ACE5EB_08560 [Thermodesulfobacteriota bacterium]